ncbi:CC0125/CC1285 family lipoprotein [Paracidovorax cattleyae]|uniref:CC0125/CC1285 family lipoprotein n=1 Tax=Paracidovorax cattleyae TaxID=80868 RepID=UPI0018AF924F|nr:hypothetical protein [Paracidovorax cattleyae]MBF9263203.1 hypothetical protein [Paracidovorax cattleyae]
MAGGYIDEKIDETHYRVKFDGNGSTSADRVWNFWLYRCAELTKEKGYTHTSRCASRTSPWPARAHIHPYPLRHHQNVAQRCGHCPVP